MMLSGSIARDCSICGSPSAARPTNQLATPAKHARDRGERIRRAEAEAQAPRLLVLPRRNEGDPEVEMGIGVVRVPLQCRGEGPATLAQVSAFVVDEAEDRMAVRRVGRERDQRTGLRLRFVEWLQVPVHPGPDLRDEGLRPEGPEGRDRALDVDGLTEQRHAALHVVPSQLLACLQEELEGAHVLDRAVRQPAVLLGGERDVQRVHDGARHPLLHVEDVVHGAVVLLGPELGVAQGVDQLCGDAERVPRAAHAPFEHIPDAELPADVAHPLGRALELHGRGPRDEPERADAREVGDELLGEPLGEILVLGVGAPVHEGQDRQRLVVRPGPAGRGLPRPERAHHERPGGGALGGRLLEEALDRLAHHLGDGVPEVRHPRGRIDEAPGDDGLHGRAGERDVAGQHLVEHAAQREEVAPAVELLPRPPAPGSCRRACRR